MMSISIALFVRKSVLKYTATTCECYRQFKSDPKICENCSSKSKCTENRNSAKTIEKHIWTNYVAVASLLFRSLY